MPYSNIMMSNISAIHEIVLILFMAGRISKMWGMGENNIGKNQERNQIR